MPFLLFIFIFLNPYLIRSILYNSNSPISISSFYPLLFIPFFLKNDSKRTLNHLQFIAGLILLIFSIYFFSFNFYWISGIILCVSFLPLLGMNFSNFGFILFLISPPFFEKYDLLISFELRLFLSNLSGFILSFIDRATSVSGNQIFFRNVNYIVDPACEGLKFLIATVLLATVFSYFYFRNGISLPKIIFLSIYWVISIILWIWTNLTRILILILFGVNSNSIWHSIIGILCFLSLIILPFFLSWIFYIREEVRFYFPTNIKKQYLLIYFLPILLFFLLIYRAKNLSIPDFSWKNNYGSFHIDISEDKESKFYRNQSATFILKKNLPFLGLGHHPKICFEAVGYHFKSEKEIQIDSEIFFRQAEVERDGRKYFLSWWYVEEIENDSRFRSGSEWLWRKKLLTSQNSFLQVNLITKTEKESIEFYKELVKKGL